MSQPLIHEEYKAGKDNEPCTVHTKLDWVLMEGKSSKLEKSVMNIRLVHSMDEINLEQFWNIENYGILSKNNRKILTRDETHAMIILETTAALKNKQYEIGLLWKSDNPKLPVSRELAENRLVFLEKRIERYPALEKKYKETINQYILKDLLEN